MSHNSNWYYLPQFITIFGQKSITEVPFRVMKTGSRFLKKTKTCVVF